MKRDMNLIREILLRLESDRLTALSEPIRDWSIEQVKYHKSMILDAKLARGKDLSRFVPDGDEFELYHLTSKGHDFVDAARNDLIWQAAQSKVDRIGNAVTIEIMLILLKKIIREQLRLS